MKVTAILFLPFFLFSFSSESIGLDKAFIQLAKKVRPSVVNISTTKEKKRSLIELAPGFFIPHHTPKMMGAGSGFIIDKNGLIVTNAHVIKEFDKIQVQFEGSDKLHLAKVIGKDQLSDIALLKVSAKKNLTPIPLGNSQNLQVGEWVAAIGNPHGYGHTMTKGIISAVKREIDDLNLFPLLQTDASINPGNSGGPLINLKGEVVGVNNAIAAGANGISFAIPINNVKTVLDDLKKYGRVRRGFIGIQFRQNFNNQGATITDIVTNGPANQSGLAIGDIIIKYNSTVIKKSRDLPKAVGKSSVSKPSTVIALRNGKQKTFKITPQVLGEKGFTLTSNTSKKKGKAILNSGLEVANPTPQILKTFELPNLGIPYPIITKVLKNSPSDQAGLQAGDFISQIEYKKIRSIKELKSKLKKGHHNLQILRYHQGYDQYLAFIVKLSL